MEKKDIQTFDSNGEWHGYHEWYCSYGIIFLRVVFKHGLEMDYEEWHGTKSTNFYIR
jgi:hypothetical protein